MKKQGIMDVICSECRRKIAGRRQAALQDYARGVSVDKISQVYGLSRWTIYKAIKEAKKQR